MEILRRIRDSAGPRRTVGLSDDQIKHFLAQDVNLGIAIKSAQSVWETLDRDTTYGMNEVDLIRELREGWCNFYAEDTINPYVPLFAKGPWIITLHGAVVHDSGGYGMLGFGHNPDNVLAILDKPMVMANIMTPSLSQRRLISALKQEIGHTRPGKRCPYDQFILMNSGSEGNSVADRIIDTHTGHVRGNRQHVIGISLRQSFHGRTFKPAILSDSSGAKYIASKCDLLSRMKKEYHRLVEPNDLNGLREIFSKAESNQEYIEAMFIEAVMGEGNPGQKITPEFYSLARELTRRHDSMLVIDSVQAGIRCHGVLSVMDYPGFESLECPDFEVFSKAINGGQFPVSIIALSHRAVASYKRGVYGNTMTTNPRACEIVATIVESLSEDGGVVRNNICEMGDYAVNEFKKLQARYPKAITNVTGTGLLYAVHLDVQVYPVVAIAGAEYWLRSQGVGVIHGGENALRFTPHFNVGKDEIDLQVNTLEKFLKATGYLAPQLEMIEHVQEGSRGRATSDFPGEVRMYFVKGHLFDRNVVNKLLNVVETNGCVANISRLRLGCCASEESEMTIEIRPSGISGTGPPSSASSVNFNKIETDITNICQEHNCSIKPTTREIELERL
jgi:acetylornithine/succinyldiaminopimelate/putrescine aminotransferase